MNEYEFGCVGTKGKNQVRRDQSGELWQLKMAYEQAITTVLLFGNWGKM